MFIEAGYHNQNEISVVFVDLTAANDTVWRQELIYKLLKTIGSKTIARLIGNMLSNCTPRVHMGDRISKRPVLNDGHPQGSVLAPLLFNLYISNLPETRSKKICYANDMALGFSHRILAEIENALNGDLITMNDYLVKWRLKLSLTKTETSYFHLNNEMANVELNVQLNGNRINHSKFSKYFGVVLDS
ncbi:hypothetical protein JTB14_008814 [Gonioctena quinquepunctata]|nr:hypothetical protein JTB14_008814 [Gonioctena quinquepunctata]